MPIKPSQLRLLVRACSMLNLNLSVESGALRTVSDAARYACRVADRMFVGFGARWALNARHAA